MREELARIVFACICHAVTEDEVTAAVGMGAATVEAVGSVTGAGTGCGSCQDRIEDLIGERCRACPLARQTAGPGRFCNVFGIPAGAKAGDPARVGRCRVTGGSSSS